MKTLDDLIRRLAYARQVLAEHQAKLAQLEKDIEAEYGELRAELTHNVNFAFAEVEEDLKAVRELAVSTFEETEDKHPHPAVSVGVYTHLEYDTTEALDYCIEHGIEKAFRLDSRAFKKIAEAMEPPFVTRIWEPRAKVKSDLSEYLDPL